jgi:hypothetical protein
MRSVLLIDNIAAHTKLASSLIPLSYAHCVVCIELSFRPYSWLYLDCCSARILCLKSPDISIIRAILEISVGHSDGSSERILCLKSPDISIIRAVSLSVGHSDSWSEIILCLKSPDVSIIRAIALSVYTMMSFGFLCDCYVVIS